MFFCMAACLFILFDQKQFEMAFIGPFGMYGIEDLFPVPSKCGCG